MLSSVFIANKDATVLIEKQYREHIERTDIEPACLAIRDKTKPVPGIIQGSNDTILVLHLQDQIWLIGVSTQDEFAALPIAVLRYLGRVLGHRLAGGATEQGVKDEYAVVYQILDWCVDFGYPFLDEEAAVQTLLDQPVTDYAKGQKLHMDLVQPWRRVNPKWRENHLLLDVTETVDLVVGPGGHIDFCHIRGQVDAQCRLTGKPVLKLFINPQWHCEDCVFHRGCENENIEAKQVKCAPADGDFTLLRYRVTATQSNLPVWITPKFAWSKTGAHFTVEVVPGQGVVRAIEQLRVIVALPTGVLEPCVEPQEGMTTWERDTCELTWHLGEYRKTSPTVLRGSLSVAEGFEIAGRHPKVYAKFLTTGVATSGFRIERVDVEGSVPAPHKGVKYVVKAGDYEFRTGLL